MQSRAERRFCIEGVPLHEGFTQITARYNDCTDSLALEKVEEKPEIYTLPKNEDEEGMEGAANWFDQAAAEAANAGEMVFPEGYFSIRDKITDIIENDEGKFYVLYPFFENPEDAVNDSGEYYIFEVTEIDGEEELAEIEDDDKLNRIAAVFEERYNEEFYDEDD